jgi:hypothetical protein
MFSAGAGWILRSFGFQFFAAKFSLEKFHNGLNWFCLGGRVTTRSGSGNRQKDELLKYSCWPADALPPSHKLITTTCCARKQQSAGF